jgi:hypothetical protein
MRKFGAWLTGLLWVGIAFLLPMVALEPVICAGVQAAGSLAATACDDGSAHLAMGCASILL